MSNKSLYKTFFKDNPAAGVKILGTFQGKNKIELSEKGSNEDDDATDDGEDRMDGDSDGDNAGDTSLLVPVGASKF